MPCGRKNVEDTFTRVAEVVDDHVVEALSVSLCRLVFDVTMCETTPIMDSRSPRKKRQEGRELLVAIPQGFVSGYRQETCPENRLAKLLSVKRVDADSVKLDRVAMTLMLRSSFINTPVVHSTTGETCGPTKLRELACGKNLSNMPAADLSPKDPSGLSLRLTYLFILSKRLVSKLERTVPLRDRPLHRL